jgi:lipopolysaccharide biosynthesis regulator YciM
MSSVSPNLSLIAQRFLDRAEAMNYRGKQKNDAAMDYLHGALTIADLTKQDQLAIDIATLLYAVEDEGWQRLKEIARTQRQYA